MTIDRIAASLDFDASALQLRSQRAQVLASNLANADTPNFKARDFSFADALREATGVASTAAGTAAAVPLVQTNPGHMTAGAATGGGPTLLYRTPMQSALDGNTVEPDVERSAFVDNSLRYQEGLKYMSNQIKTLLTAVNGQ